MSNTISSEDVKEFFNSTFFPEGRPQNAQISVTIRRGDKMVIIPGVKAHPGTTLNDLFHEYHDYLKENGPMGEISTKEADQNTNPLGDDGQVLDFEQVDYRGNTYLVEERENDLFVVRRTTDNEVLNNQSPTVKAIIKSWKEARK